MAGGGPTIRPADLTDPADGAALAGLRWEWRIDRGEVPPNSRATFDRDFAVWCVAHAATHRAFVATDPADGLVVGMAWFGFIERVPGPEHWTRRSGSVQSVYVTPAERGRGGGERLVRAVVASATELGLDHLLVHPTELSVPLYRRIGFTERDRALEISLRS